MIRILAAVGCAVLLSALPARAQQCGDPNGNGIDVIDAANVLRQAVGLPSSCSANPTLCDVDAVGGVTVIDAANVLRQAVGLPAQIACAASSDVTDVVDRVETRQGQAPTISGPVPIPSSDTQTVDDNFDFNASGVGMTSPNDKVIAGGSNMLGVDFNAAAASPEIAAAGDTTLIVAVQRQDGTFMNGYFEVPLQSLTGQETLTSVFSQQLGNQPFSLAFATRRGTVVSRYTPFPQQPVRVTPSSLTISLSIYPSQDLDLFLWEPGQDPHLGDPGICLRGSRCFQISPNGGQLDLDANRECTVNFGVNNEHITYPGVVPPRGQYQVGVGFFQNCTGSGAAFTVVVSAGTQRLITNGFFSAFDVSPGTAKIVQRFTIL
jgi:hypothetical protein